MYMCAYALVLCDWCKWCMYELLCIHCYVNSRVHTLPSSAVWVLLFIKHISRLAYISSICMYANMYVCMDGWMDGWMDVDLEHSYSVFEGALNFLVTSSY